MVVPLAFSGGIGLFFLVMLFASRGGPSPREIPIILGFLATLPLCLVSLFTRRRFNRLELVTRRILAIAAMVMTSTLFVWLIIFVRG